MKCYQTQEKQAVSVKKDLFQGQRKLALPLQAGACLASGDWVSYHDKVRISP